MLKYFCLPFLLLSTLLANDTYFSYSEKELQRFKGLDSDHIITKESLIQWDQRVEEYVAKKPALYSSGHLLRIFTYLYVAQRDFASLSHQLHGAYKGSIDPVSLGVIRLFYPFFPLPRGLVIDKYSVVLSELILGKLKQRFEDEKQVEHFLSVSQWTFQASDFGKAILSWVSWRTPSILFKTITVPPPSMQSTDFWEDQLQQVRKMSEAMTEEERKNAQFWSYFFEPKGGNWITIINNFLFSSDISLRKIMNVRALASIAMYDALIVAFESKYTFSIIPPYVADKRIKVLRELPYPSYPSLHASISYAAATVMSFFFPEKQSKWESIAEEVSHSRVLAGTNYPIDIEMGEELGVKVGDYVLSEEGFKKE
ncbi:MAG: phosphatase PAP2 family protein [Chlamydiales bacterium]